MGGLVSEIEEIGKWIVYFFDVEKVYVLSEEEDRGLENLGKGRKFEIVVMEIIRENWVRDI